MPPWSWTWKNRRKAELRPYLMAPMTMVAVDRSIFPSGQPIEFDFQVNGKPAAKVVATID